MSIFHKPGAKSVFAVVFDQQKKSLLLITRRDVPIWTLPGGGVDEGESPETAVIREVKEETGLTVKIIRLVSTYTPVNKLTNQTFLFKCEVISGDLNISNETSQVHFFPLDQLPAPFFFIHHNWVKETQQQLSHVINRPLKEATYFNIFIYLCRHPVQFTRFVLSRLGFSMDS